MKVSISLIAYNQEKYIAKAIESVLSQKTNFDFELVISNDCSSDSTGDIINAYALKYPDIIRCFDRPNNLGLVENATKTIADCRGEYVALLEGDDYWIDDNKLQLQSDFLDANRDCAFCYTNGKALWLGSGKVTTAIGSKPPTKFTLKYYLENNVVLQNNTKMFRKSAHPTSLPKWYFEVIQWDWCLHVFHAMKGDIGYLDITSLLHLRHEDSVIMSTNKIELFESALRTNKEMDKYLNFEFHDVLARKEWYYEELMVASFATKKYFRFVHFLFLTIWSNPLRSYSGYRDLGWKLKQTQKNE